MRRHFAIVLLFGVLAMNMDMICQSLCLSGHNDMADGHASHLPAQADKTAKHDMPKGEMCPTAQSAEHGSHHTTPKTFIQCDCSADQVATLGFELTIADTFTDLKPPSHIVSKIHPQKENFSSKEPAPFEGPPKLIS